MTVSAKYALITNRLRILKMWVGKWPGWCSFKNVLGYGIAPQLYMIASGIAFFRGNMDAAKIFALWAIFWQAYSLRVDRDLDSD